MYNESGSDKIKISLILKIVSIF